MISISTMSPRTKLFQRTSGATTAPTGGGDGGAFGTATAPGWSSKWIVEPGGSFAPEGTAVTVPLAGGGELDAGAGTGVTVVGVTVDAAGGLPH